MPLDRRLVHEKAIALGFDLVGVTSADPPESLPIFKRWLESGYHGEMDYMARSLPLRSDLNNVLAGVRSVIAVGLNYFQPLEHEPSEARIARYALGRDYHKVMRRKLKALAAELGEEIPHENWRACVDSAPILEREYANRAGIGWYGKNTCLINSHRGSWFLIGVLLTSAEIEHDKPAIGGCGTCRLCIDACPTGAIVELDGIWQVDARKCISYLTIEKRGELTRIESEMVGDWTFGCDICQEVCPFNQVRESQPLRSQVTQEEAFLNRKRWPSLVNLLQMNREEWEQTSRGSAVRRSGYEGLKRNASANIANIERDGIEDEDEAISGP